MRPSACLSSWLSGQPWQHWPDFCLPLVVALKRASLVHSAYASRLFLPIFSGAAAAARACAHRHAHQDGPRAAGIPQGHRALGAARRARPTLLGELAVAFLEKQACRTADCAARQRALGLAANWDVVCCVEIEATVDEVCCMAAPRLGIASPHDCRAALCLQPAPNLARPAGSWWQRARAARSAAGCCRCARQTCCWRFRRWDAHRFARSGDARMAVDCGACRCGAVLAAFGVVAVQFA
jgi:hypothetical protein